MLKSLFKFPVNKRKCRIKNYNEISIIIIIIKHGAIDLEVKMVTIKAQFIEMER